MQRNWKYRSKSSISSRAPETTAHILHKKESFISLSQFRFFLFIVIGYVAFEVIFPTKWSGISRSDILLQQALRTVAERPFPTTNCRSRLEVGDPCDVGRLSQILANLSLNQNHDKSVIELLEVLRRYSVFIDGNNESFAENFIFFRSQLLFRIAIEFENNQLLREKYYDHDITRSVIHIFDFVVKQICAPIENLDSSHIKGSENITFMSYFTCWAYHRLIWETQKLGEVREWEDKISAFLSTTVRTGLMVEFFSPSYSRHSLNNVYGWFDFAHSVSLREAARGTLDLWWALWAQEEIAGRHGGTKTRAYSRLLGNGYPMDGLGDFYFGDSLPAVAVRDPALVGALASRYRPATAVQAIRGSREAKPPYEVIHNVSGVLASPSSSSIYHLERSKPLSQRYSFVSSSYVMSSANFFEKDLDKIAAISSQNRWIGVEMAGKTASRVIIFPKPGASERSAYAGFDAVQRKSTQYIRWRSEKERRNTESLGIHVSCNLNLHVEREWIFVDGPAYVALRVTGLPISSRDKECNFYLKPEVGVILQAAERSQFSGFGHFKDEVKRRLRQDEASGELYFEGLLGAGSFPLRNIAHIETAEDIVKHDAMAYVGPFVKGRWGGGRIQITAGRFSRTIDIETWGGGQSVRQ